MNVWRATYRPVPTEDMWLDLGERAATTLAEQLNGLPDLIHLVECGERLEAFPVALGPLLRRVWSGHEGACKEKDISIQAIFTNGNIVTHAVLLGCGLRNLVCNALKTPAAPRVGIPETIMLDLLIQQRGTPR